MAELQLPNIVGQFQQGQQFGQQQRANKLAGLAYGAQGADRQAALGQLAGVDPRLAVGLGNALQSQDQAQAQAAQAQEVDHNKKINGAARFMLQAVQSGDPARIQGAYQTVRPYLAELGASQGKVPPEQFDPSMLPHLYQIVGDSGGMPDNKGVVVNAGGQLRDPTTGQLLAENPANPANAQIIKVPDGNGGTVDMIFDPRTRQLTRPDFGGAPQGADLGAINAKAGELVNSGQMSPEQADAWIKQQYAGAGVPIEPAGGGLGYAPPKDSQQKETWNQPVDETSPDGKPIRVQYSNLGNRRIVEGAAPAKNLRTTTPNNDQNLAAGFAVRMLNASKELDALEQGGYDPTNLRDRAATAVGGYTGNKAISPQGQQYQQAAQNWVRANLRKESGAAISKDEMDKEIANYFPVAGDTPETVKQKARNRHVVEQNMVRSAGPAWDKSAVQADSQPAQARPRATNPQTGQTLEFDGQQWVPVNG